MFSAVPFNITDGEVEMLRSAEPGQVFQMPRPGMRTPEGGPVYGKFRLETAVGTRRVFRDVGSGRSLTLDLPEVSEQ